MERYFTSVTGHNYQNGICKNCGAKDPTYVDIHPGTPKVKAKAKGDRKIKLSWSKAKKMHRAT